MIWPLWRFWAYTPLGFVCAVIWNACEIAGVSVPAAPWVFGKIINAKGERKTPGD